MGFEHRTMHIQRVANRYTDNAIQAPTPTWKAKLFCTKAKRSFAVLHSPGDTEENLLQHGRSPFRDLPGATVALPQEDLRTGLA